MSVFVGNISKYLKTSELEDYFTEFGNCKFRHKKAFCFAEFDSEKDAAMAIEKLNGKYLGGLRIGVEWARHAPQFDEKKRN
jgi:RNA recognition motif-containing protein